uniref:Uncharacterized protein n=1 Tax=Romanomermis culicivorax TaxID=13658 RepID=A0A915L8Q6_ROMCU
MHVYIFGHLKGTVRTINCSTNWIGQDDYCSSKLTNRCLKTETSRSKMSCLNLRSASLSTLVPEPACDDSVVVADIGF